MEKIFLKMKYRSQNFNSKNFWPKSFKKLWNMQDNSRQKKPKIWPRHFAAYIILLIASRDFMLSLVQLLVTIGVMKKIVKQQWSILEHVNPFLCTWVNNLIYRHTYSYSGASNNMTKQCWWSNKVKWIDITHVFLHIWGRNSTKYNGK